MTSRAADKPAGISAAPEVLLVYTVASSDRLAGTMNELSLSRLCSQSMTADCYGQRS